MNQDPVDLSQIFGAALSQLAANRESLNRADTGNHDHGDNMVRTFEIITQTLGQHEGDAASTALAAASKALGRESKSGSGQIYAQGLAQAATALKGEHLTADNAIDLINLVLGGGASAPAPAPEASTPAAADDGGIDIGDILSAGAQILAGSRGGSGGQGGAGSGKAEPEPADQGGIDMGDLIAAGAQILAGRGGSPGQAAEPPAQEGASAGGADLGSLFNMWMAYRSAKQRGSSDFDAILNAVLARSRTAQSAPYRQKSTEIVANALLQAVLGHR